MNKRRTLVGLGLLWSFSSLLFAQSYGNANSSNPPDQPIKFSLGHIPDTQSFFYHSHYTGDPANCLKEGQHPQCDLYSSPGQIYDMYKWLLQTKTNSEFPLKGIMHVGDIIEMGGCSRYALRDPKTHQIVGYRDVPNWPENLSPVPGFGAIRGPNPKQQWTTASNLVSQIQGLNAGHVPLGFATGNHDLGNPGCEENNHVFGNGKLSTASDTALLVGKFMQTVHTNSDKGNEWEALSSALPGVADGKYLVTAKSLELSPKPEIPKLRIYNIPYFQDASAGLQTSISAAIRKDIITRKQEGKKELVIFNIHSCAHGDAMAAAVGGGGVRNIFMVLCGHDPGWVGNNGTFNIIPGDPRSYGVGADKQNYYSYRLDYQAHYDNNPAVAATLPDGSHFLPQQPIVQYYDFTLDGDNLSWKVSTKQVWNPDSETKGGEEVTREYGGLNLASEFYPHQFLYKKDWPRTKEVPFTRGWAANLTLNSAPITHKDVHSISIANYLGGVTPVPPTPGTCPLPTLNTTTSDPNCNRFFLDGNVPKVKLCVNWSKEADGMAVNSWDGSQHLATLTSQNTTYIDVIKVRTADDKYDYQLQNHCPSTNPANSGVAKISVTGGAVCSSPEKYTPAGSDCNKQTAAGVVKLCWKGSSNNASDYQVQNYNNVTLSQPVLSQGVTRDPTNTYWYATQNVGFPVGVNSFVYRIVGCKDKPKLEISVDSAKSKAFGMWDQAAAYCPPPLPFTNKMALLDRSLRGCNAKSKDGIYLSVCFKPQPGVTSYSVHVLSPEGKEITYVTSITAAPNQAVINQTVSLGGSSDKVLHASGYQIQVFSHCAPKMLSNSQYGPLQSSASSPLSFTATNKPLSNSSVTEEKAEEKKGAAKASDNDEDDEDLLDAESLENANRFNR